MRRLALLIVLATLTGAAPQGHWWSVGPALPRSTGRVVDGADVLPAAIETQLDKALAGLEARTGHQLAVVTVASLHGEPINDFSVRVFRTWGIGRRVYNDGVLLVVAPTERKVRIEVGYGLERQLTDPVCAAIIRTQIVPRFAAGELPAGVVAGVAAIVERIDSPVAAPARRP